MEASVPRQTRARFTMLMLRLYVDRDPQTSKPQVPLHARVLEGVHAFKSANVGDIHF